MKALLMKDFFVLYKRAKVLLFALVLFCTLPGLSATAFCTIYVLMLSITTLSYDERSKWNQLAAMMPYTPFQLVFSKYVLGYIGAAAVSLLSCLSQLIMKQLPFANYPTTDLLSTALLFPCIGIVLLSILLPIMIRLGTEKGRMVYLVTVGILGGLSATVSPEHLEMLQISSTVMIPVLLVLTIAINLISIRLAVVFYTRNKT